MEGRERESAEKQGDKDKDKKLDRLTDLVTDLKSVIDDLSERVDDISERVIDPFNEDPYMEVEGGSPFRVRIPKKWDHSWGGAFPGKGNWSGYKYYQWSVGKNVPDHDKVVVAEHRDAPGEDREPYGVQGLRGVNKVTLYCTFEEGSKQVDYEVYFVPQHRYFRLYVEDSWFEEDKHKLVRCGDHADCGDLEYHDGYFDSPGATPINARINGMVVDLPRSRGDEVHFDKHRLFLKL